MKKIKKIGITGQDGFVGKHLYNTLGLAPGKYKRISFEKAWMNDPSKLDAFVTDCDVIVHLAAMNRHEVPEVIYQTNIDLVRKLIASLERTNSCAHVLFSSSSHEERNNSYGQSKRKGRELLAQWVMNSRGKFTGLVIPNVFGPFGKPNYNSFVATFCYRLTHGRQPNIQVDGVVQLIYVGELVGVILDKIDEAVTEPDYLVPHTVEAKVSEVLAKLENYTATYLANGEIPELKTVFDLNLFNTYRSYIDYENRFPIRFIRHVDNRGSFVEVIRLGVGGQVSFSTTQPGVTRGNHYHTRKIERFAVIKGKALIQMRKIGSNEVLSFVLGGDQPAYVDMPIWYTHNIKNIGDGILYTNFWISEPYDPKDSDTYMEDV